MTTRSLELWRSVAICLAVLCALLSDDSDASGPCGTSPPAIFVSNPASELGKGPLYARLGSWSGLAASGKRQEMLLLAGDNEPLVQDGTAHPDSVTKCAQVADPMNPGASETRNKRHRLCVRGHGRIHRLRTRGDENARQAKPRGGPPASVLPNDSVYIARSPHGRSLVLSLPHVRIYAGIPGPRLRKPA